ncbi:ATP phosphoribosyltransferase regulatory subunit [Bacillus badius]|uniref:ATP phosphoribosyltransferase regulatory subunit n=1 Tax=Bacillus badius TaxID=1455 RepID=A0ABR5AWW5_BACBA|nr:ATP phosphoribosyltransferase regulatory subunit [Bacillus badius]KIL76194.1 ATP phosphoribosyltransferase regulatory subunit [Bacillus badius]KIL79240.1 ATP phosphoribosyltransferase regulatory subunit [Bacillus badius]KZO00247.1 ATP phosphoribosyltransferase regulatory subunit [Bacillus badius]KZR59952.1 ATP phosphoribosyltransferase regulatory subunit [Bacillus badius]MED0668289.1 ATP phosphoribosyltransferase regulatory subunit [Bacillus badius]
MSKLLMFEKPVGMRDTLPHIYETKRKLKEAAAAEMRSWGYRFIETPALEYYETVGAASAILDRQLFKLLDQQGNTLVLRPDMTTPIARVAASKLLKERVPLRLAYSASVYRAQQREGGRAAEFEQIGVEMIGDQTVSADAELIALLVSVLKKTGMERFRLSLGHIRFTDELFRQILGTEERAQYLRRFLYEKNYVGYREHVKGLALSSIDQQRLLRFLDLSGELNCLEGAADLIEGGAGSEAIAELRSLYERLQEYGVAEYIQFDLPLVSHMSYYTGLVFEVYVDGAGTPAGNGGRYDHLLEKFGRPASATGFGLRVDVLLSALEQLEEEEKVHCILFSNERRIEAIQEARKRREAGEAVLLQDVAGLEDVDRFTETCKSVSFFVGKAASGREF